MGTITASGGPLAAASLAGVGQITAQNAGAEYASLTGVGTLTATAQTRAPATLAGVGSMTAAGGPPVPAAVNQWSNSYGQGTVLGSTTPVLQSCVTPLDSAFSVAPGTTTSTAGNWLFAIVTWTQDPTLAEAHVNVADDIHSYWRQFPASSISGKTRTTIAYTPNIARSAGNVYVAPDNEIIAINVLVVEISGLGPWDTLAGTFGNYAAAAESLSLSRTRRHRAPSSSARPEGITPPPGRRSCRPSGRGWSPRRRQTAPITCATTSSPPRSCRPQPPTRASREQRPAAENMSGFILGVEVAAASPVPANHNPNWPYFIFEAAFGGGFNTPNSELTWTDISTRLWRYDETTGIQYQLGSLQATNLSLELDNFDAALSPENSSSPFYPDVTSGTPLRIRAALGTLGGVTSNRWYVIQRNAQEWPEEIDESFRRFSPATGTDVWAAMSAAGPTPYRGEVYTDNPYAWWPCDDQPQAEGVLPTFLLNAALGNTNDLNILLSPLGAAFYSAYDTDGSAGGAPSQGGVAPGGSANYTVGTDSEWMFGDPESTPATALSGNDITASPGSAAWQTTGQYGHAGSNGWFLSCNDSSFPLSRTGSRSKDGLTTPSSEAARDGTTTFRTSSTTAASRTSLTLIEIATGSNPVAVLQLDISGHLNLITYNGAAGTSNPIYSGSDLRSQSWFMVTMTLTETTWTVWIDGGDLAQVSGAATGMTSAWTWFIANADMGSGGGGATSGIVHGGNVAIAHLAVYPCVLPAYRIAAHYWAAVTGFGLLPAPQNITLAQAGNGEISDVDPAGYYIHPGRYRHGRRLRVHDGRQRNRGNRESHGGTSRLSRRRLQLRSVRMGADRRRRDLQFRQSFRGRSRDIRLLDRGSDEIQRLHLNAGRRGNRGRGYPRPERDLRHGIRGFHYHQPVHRQPGCPRRRQRSLTPGSRERHRRHRGREDRTRLGYGNVTYPGRCIDQAPLLVQAALDVGGQAASQNVQNIAISDGGMLFVDNVGAHHVLAAASPGQSVQQPRVADRADHSGRGDPVRP